MSTGTAGTEEVRRLNGELERQVRELDAFAYSVSHDLRAPLRGLLAHEAGPGPTDWTIP